MRTIKLLIQYNGAGFSGWQIQPGKRTVQGTLQDTLRKVLCDDIALLGCSRTDAGVHALGQVAHFKTKNPIALSKLHQALKRLMPDDIAVIKVTDEAATFHSQHKAKKKLYRYWIWNAPIVQPHLKGMSWHIPKPLNLLAMKKAAKYLVGTHDFMSFRAADATTKTSVRTIYQIRFRKADWVGKVFENSKGGQGLFCIEFVGNGFLKNMIRNIMGTLVDIGRGRIPPEEMKVILKSRDRQQAGMKVPAQGLFLVKVYY